jgi:hypothetical protein
MKNQIEFTRVDCDSCANSRFVCHFFNFINEKDEEKAKELEKINPSRSYISRLYDIAVSKARTINGSKYRAKHYGGGIVFTTPNPEEIEKKIIDLKNK